VRLRIGLVLGTEGGMLANMLAPFEYGLGGPFGSDSSGRRGSNATTSCAWSRNADRHARVGRPVNATAPEPVRNAAFARENLVTRSTVRCSWRFCPLLRLLGDLAEELCLAAQVIPRKALKSGFAFRHAQPAQRAGRPCSQRTRDSGPAANMSLPGLPAGGGQEVNARILRFRHCDTDQCDEGQCVNPLRDLTLSLAHFHMPQ